MDAFQWAWEIPAPSLACRFPCSLRLPPTVRRCLLPGETSVKPWEQTEFKRFRRNSLLERFGLYASHERESIPLGRENLACMASMRERCAY